MESSGRSIIEVPEILALVVHWLGSKEQPKLMSVSKYFFHSVGPIVWKIVPRLDIIMGLVIETKVDFRAIKHFPGYKPRQYEITIILPLNPDFSRYNIYASWVQDLELFGGNTQEIKNLDQSLIFFNDCPPLPNLQRLTAYTITPISSKYLMSLINMFVCPSLVEIRTILQSKDENDILQTSSAHLPSSSIPAFLNRIKELCPQIRVLEFYPELVTPGSSSERYTPSGWCLNALSSFLNLRSFSSTTYILEPATLGVLGELPHLESLGIRGSPTEHSYLDKRLSIPEVWFPALKSLQLYDVHHEDIQILWNQPTIAKRLISAIIQTDHLTLRNPPDDTLHGQNWIGPFLAALPHLSPQLLDLAFFMGDEASRVEIPQESWAFIIRGHVSPGDAYSMALWPNLDDYSLCGAAMF